MTTNLVKDSSLNSLSPFEKYFENWSSELKSNVLEYLSDLNLGPHSCEVLLGDSEPREFLGEKKFNCCGFIGVVLHLKICTLGSATLCCTGLGISYLMVGTPKTRFSSPSLVIFLNPYLLVLPRLSSGRTSYSFAYPFKHFPASHSLL